MGKFFFRLFTGLHARLYKLFGGRFFGGGSKDGSVLVLTHKGAKSGKLRDTPLMFVNHDDGYLLIGSAGGSDQNPGWYYNLMANPETTVHIAGETVGVRAHDAGAERDALWDKVVDTEPRFGRYESRTERVIPVVILEKV
ncbi:MAG: nitroreductase family deazaflavin-dependent oxidoreductase [Actinomycetota bacterium]|nr:nitroreductase family deazaflavin-dependent oxidoreductase [Actinomycetota bacterium]